MEYPFAYDARKFLLRKGTEREATPEHAASLAEFQQQVEQTLGRMQRRRDHAVQKDAWFRGAGHDRYVRIELTAGYASIGREEAERVRAEFKKTGWSVDTEPRIADKPYGDWAIYLRDPLLPEDDEALPALRHLL